MSLESFKTLPRRIVTLPIVLYRWTISPFLGSCCRFYPSCSAYAEAAILKHGVAKGSLLAIKRLLRCHPWNSGGGFDPP